MLFSLKTTPVSTRNIRHNLKLIFSRTPTPTLFAKQANRGRAHDAKIVGCLSALALNPVSVFRNLDDFHGLISDKHSRVYHTSDSSCKNRAFLLSGQPLSLVIVVRRLPFPPFFRGVNCLFAWSPFSLWIFVLRPVGRNAAKFVRRLFLMHFCCMTFIVLRCSRSALLLFFDFHALSF